MRDRANILGRLRRWKGGAARYVVGSFAIAYLSAGIAPCAMAATRATDDSSAAALVAHEDHAAHERDAAHAQHGNATHGDGVATHDGAPAPAHDRSGHCPHCPPGAGGDHAVCAALEDLTNAAASHAKDAPQSAAPPLAPAAFTLPPTFTSPWPPPPLRVVRGTSVPLNVRHCVFVI